jgi:hypothetical protein
MRVLHRLGLLTFGFAIPLAAQTSCTPDALASAAKSVAAVRHQLHEQSVPENDPNVPAGVAAQLGQLKQALAASAEAAFACANGSASPDSLQKQLADALHANVASATGTVETRGKRDFGAYGSDLSVQVFQLFGRPKFVEVDFRYGVECGDDNLLMVFEAADDSASSPWHESLNWSAPAYTTVSDALGDFAMLTPLTGSFKSPNWRFLVAHGHPGCGTTRQSRFDLDLLSPAADPAKPRVDWHFEHPYTEDHVVPRLATTEDTVEFRIQHEGKTAKGGAAADALESFRFHLTANGQLEPVSAAADENSAGSPARPGATANSPQ